MAAPTAWNKAKVKAFKAGFLDFLQYAKIASKDLEDFQPIVLYGAQKRFLSEVFTGLENDIHSFVVLKARQLGLSTIVRLLLLYWAFMNPGARIALVYDTDSNKGEARAELQGVLRELPDTHKIPIKKGGDNRDFLELANGSRISYFVAGTKKTRGSSGLGRSRGINVCGCTEMSSWGDIEGLRAFERSLSDIYPNRLYIWESTARGFNIFHDIWTDALADDLTKRTIFIGWWAKESYSHARGTPLFERYGTRPPTDDEQEKIDTVESLYNHKVSMEQLAWYRHQFDPANLESDETGAERAGEEIIQQELPWFAEEAWLTTGSAFFPADKLTLAMKDATKAVAKGYRYYMSEEFTATLVEPVRFLRQAQLKVWEEPDPAGVYAVGADPAGGSSETSDRFCVQVLRCYADGIDQVAEFCTPMLTTYQFAWVIAHLCGAYGGPSGGARLLLEINGVGMAVLTAFRELEFMLKHGHLPAGAEESGMQNIFDNVRQYMYSRQDSISRSPTAFHWQTSGKNKILILERMRDFVNIGALRVNSIEALQEMQKVTRDGDHIAAEGSAKDDRVMGLALAARAWEEGERRRLILTQRTRENEKARSSMGPGDLQALFSQQLVSDFFNRQARQRRALEKQAKKGRRYNW